MGIAERSFIAHSKKSYFLNTAFPDRCAQFFFNTATVRPMKRDGIGIPKPDSLILESNTLHTVEVLTHALESTLEASKFRFLMIHQATGDCIFQLKTGQTFSKSYQLDQFPSGSFTLFSGWQLYQIAKLLESQSGVHEFFDDGTNRVKRAENGLPYRLPKKIEDWPVFNNQ